MKAEVSRRFSEPLRKRVVEQIESGIMSVAEASREYGASKATIQSWLRDFGKFKPRRDIVEVVMKDEKEKIEELQKALADAHLKLRIYDKMIEFANKEYKTDLKKSFGAEASFLSKKKDSK
jgi:transposase